MKKVSLLIFLILIFGIFISVSYGKELPKVAVWDLVPREVKPPYAQELTSILVSEISKLGKYEVYSQENVRTLAGWTAERMQLGCTDTKCLTALGQMDIAKLVSGSVGKIGARYSISLNLFDTQKARAENAISEFCHSEDELIDLVQSAVRKLLGVEITAGERAVTPTDSGKSLKDPYTGMEFVFIKGGCYEMGDTFRYGSSNEKPIHEVCVDDFYLGTYEVTQGQWEMVMGSNPSFFKRGSNYPVVVVSWNDVKQFIDKLNNQTGRTYRLPTEAEWEYAGRSGGKKEKFAGTSREEELSQYAWYDNNSARTSHAVGQKNPNGFGLYDMSGNVWEWCADWYNIEYYKNSPKNDPKGPDNGISRVVRGGSCVDSPEFVRAAHRSWALPSYKGETIGFRLSTSAP